MYNFCNLSRRVLTGIISGKLPKEMESFDVQLEAVAVKDILGVTGQTLQHYNRMQITQVHRKKRSFGKADDPLIVDSLYEYLHQNSNIANRDKDSRMIENETVRYQYLNEAPKRLFEKFLAINEFPVSNITLWHITKRHDKFKIFKTAKNTNLQVALCDKCLKLELLRATIADTELDYLNIDQMLAHTTCENSNQRCYDGSCRECSKSNFAQWMRDSFPDTIDRNRKIIIAELKKSKTGEDIVERETTFEAYATVDIPNTLYQLGATGTGGKMANHMLRTKESTQFQKWCYSEVLTGSTIVFHMDFAMSLERRYGMETQNLHYKRKAFPLMGLIEYLPNGHKYWNWWVGETTQVKSCQFSIKAIKSMISQLPNQIEDPNAITKVIIASDGAASEFWCSEIMFHYFDVYDDIKIILPNIKEVYVTKSASGHGKGEIDAT